MFEMSFHSAMCTRIKLLIWWPREALRYRPLQPMPGRYTKTLQNHRVSYVRRSNGRHGRVSPNLYVNYLEVYVNSFGQCLRKFRVFGNTSTNSGGGYSAYPHNGQKGKQKYVFNRSLMHPELSHHCDMRVDSFMLFKWLCEERVAFLMCSYNTHYNSGECIYTHRKHTFQNWEIF